MDYIEIIKEREKIIEAHREESYLDLTEEEYEAYKKLMKKAWPLGSWSYKDNIGMSASEAKRLKEYISKENEDDFYVQVIKIRCSNDNPFHSNTYPRDFATEFLVYVNGEPAYKYERRKKGENV